MAEVAALPITFLYDFMAWAFFRKGRWGAGAEVCWNGAETGIVKKGEK
jgi:hypothetical protein